VREKADVGFDVCGDVDLFVERSLRRGDAPTPPATKY
jgi:hypothetical protein